MRLKRDVTAPSDADLGKAGTDLSFPLLVSKISPPTQQVFFLRRSFSDVVNERELENKFHFIFDYNSRFS